jgi:hypothetical protein
MNPYVIIGLGAAWLASLVGIGYWQNEAGHIAERTEWQTRENGELRTANATIKALQEKARKSEHDHAAALATVSTDYERKLGDANKQRAADAAALRAGTLRLRDPSPTGLRSCGSLGAKIGTSPGERDGAQGGELSDAAAGFLLDLASDADDVARQLAACQEVVVKDRELR